MSLSNTPTNPLDGVSKILGRSIHKTYKQRNRVSVMVKVGELLVTAGASDGEIQVTDLSTGQLVEIMKGHTDCVYGLLLHDGKLWSAGEDRTLRCWKTEPPFACLGTISLPEGKVTDLAPGCMCLYLLVPGGTVYTHSVKDMSRLPAVFDHAEPIICIRYASHALWSMSRTSVIKWNTRTQQQLLRFDIKCHSPVSMHIGTEKIVFTTISGAVYITDHRGANRGVVIYSQPIKAAATWEAASMLFLAGKDGVITFWDMLTCTQLETIPAHERPVNTLMLCGSTLFSGSSDKFVVTWNVSDIVGNLTDEDTSPNIEEEKSGSSCCCVQ